MDGLDASGLPACMEGGVVIHIIQRKENPLLIDSVNFSISFDMDTTLSAYRLSILSNYSTKRLLILISS